MHDGTIAYAKVILLVRAMKQHF